MRFGRGWDQFPSEESPSLAVKDPLSNAVIKRFIKTKEQYYFRLRNQYQVEPPPRLSHSWRSLTAFPGVSSKSESQCPALLVCDVSSMHAPT